MPKRQIPTPTAITAVVIAALTSLILVWSSIPATVSLQAEQVPATPVTLGCPMTLTLQANALAPPPADDFNLTLPECLDADWPPTWHWQGFSRRGFSWEAQLILWAHAPGNAKAGTLTFLPTSTVLPLPKLTFYLPEQPLLTVWTPSTAPAAGQDNDTGPAFGSPTILLLALALAVITTALIRQARTCQADAPARNILRQLSHPVQPPSADAIQTAVSDFLTRHQDAAATPDLHCLADALARSQPQDALLSPVVRRLAEALDTARFAPPQPASIQQLDYCRRMACFIVRYYRWQS